MRGRGAGDTARATASSVWLIAAGVLWLILRRRARSSQHRARMLRSHRDFSAPRGGTVRCRCMATTDEAVAATTRLRELLDQQHRLEARLDQVRAEERAAGIALEQASRELVELERAAASGTVKLSAAKRQAAEDHVLRCRMAFEAPWPQRREAVALAIQDAQRAVAVFTGANLDALLADLEAQGRRVVEKVDEACRQLLDAYAERAAVEQATFQMLSRVGRVEPRDVRRTQAEQVAAAAEALLQRGGEPWPEVLHRPHEARHVEAVPAA